MFVMAAMSIFAPKASAQETKWNSKDSTEQVPPTLQLFEAMPINTASAVYQNPFLGSYYHLGQAFAEVDGNSQASGFSVGFGSDDRKGLGIAATVQTITNLNNGPVYRFSLAPGVSDAATPLMGLAGYTYSNGTERTFGNAIVLAEISSDGNCNVGGFFGFGGSYARRNIAPTYSITVGETPGHNLIYSLAVDITIPNSVFSIGVDGTGTRDAAHSLRLGVETKVAPNLRLGASYAGPEPPGWFSTGPGSARGLTVSTELMFGGLRLGVNAGSKGAGIVVKGRL